MVGRRGRAKRTRPRHVLFSGEPFQQRHRMGRHAGAVPSKAQMLLCGGLHIHPVRIRPKSCGEVRLHLRAVGAHLGGLGDEGGVDVHHGSISIQQEMPDFLPDRLEAGTHNMPGIAGLLAGVRFVRQLGPEAICAGERQLTFQAAEGLRRLPGLQVFALPDLAAQAGVLSIVPEHMDAEALGAALADRGIAVRAGLHCAPLAHRTAGTLDTGTVRLSFSHWNTREEVSRFLVAMGEILR